MQNYPKKLGYRKEIDGLRTIAVIPVILFHLGYIQINGGYYGVDVFFVISGYLITSILTNKILSNQFSMFEFWIRRIKRLLPALITVVLFVLTIIPFVIYKLEVKAISSDIFPSIFSYFNFHAFFEFGSYWGRASEQSFFLHTWSLSVEEQFYLVYPFFLFFSYKYFKSFMIPLLIISIGSSAFFFFQLYYSKNIDFAFYMLPTRVWELSLGGMAGLITVKKLPHLATNLISIFGFLLISFSFFLGHENIDYFVMFPILGSFLIILYSNTNDLVGRVLSTKVFVLIGKLSYSLYLWHWVIIVLFKNLAYKFQYTNFHLLNLIILVITFSLSLLTYFLIENRTRNYKHTPKIVLSGILIIVTLTLFYKSNLYNPFYKSQFNSYTSYVRYYDISPTQDELNEFIEDGKLDLDLTIPERLQKFEDAYRKNGIITDFSNKTPEIMLLGDSHGVMWAKVIDEISNDLDFPLSCYTANGTSPFFNLSDINSQKESNKFTKEQRIAYAKSVVNNINKWNPKVVIIVSRWEKLTSKKKDQFNDLLNLLEEKQIQVLLLTQPPVLNFMTNKNASQYLTYLGYEPVLGYNFVDVKESSKLKEGNDYIRSKPNEYSNLSVYDVYEKTIQGNMVKISFNKEILYFDDDHLSYPGTLIHKKNIANIIDSLIN